MLTRFKQIFSHHKTLVLSFVFFFVFSGVLSVFAAAPSGGYAPNATLDPDCAPGDTDCVVTTGWEFDTVNNYVFNDTDFIGIGTDTPSARLQLHTGGDTTIGQIIRANSPTQTANMQEWQDSTGAVKLAIDRYGSWYQPTSTILTASTIDPQDSESSIFSVKSFPTIQFNPNDEASGHSFVSSQFSPVLDVTGARTSGTSYVYGTVNTLYTDPLEDQDMTYLDLRGAYGYVSHGGNVRLGVASGVSGRVINTGNGNITNARSIWARSIRNDGTGIISTAYGLYLDAQTVGTTNYSIYSAGGQSYFAGNIGLKTISPSTSLQLGPIGTGAGNTGELSFLELAVNGVNYVGFKAPDSLSGNTTYILPNALGSAGQVLTDVGGNGTLSWQTPSGGSSLFTLQSGSLFDNRAGNGTLSGSGNFLAGLNAGVALTIGANNTFIGEDAGNDNLDGSDNIAIGAYAGASNTSGIRNVFLGRAAGSSNTTGSYNFYGIYQAGYSNVSGSHNIMIGENAGILSTSSYNIFMGREAGRNNTSGGYNIFLGDNAGYNTGVGDSNIFMGANAGLTNTSGYSNIAIGSSAGRANSTGTDNVFIGIEAGYNATAGLNVMIGKDSGRATTTGYQNTYLGHSAGDTATTGLQNTVIGATADVSAIGTNNAIALGYGAIASTNEFALPDSIDFWKFNGTSYDLPDSFPGANSVLQSTSAGIMTWETATTSPITIENTTSLFSTGLPNTGASSSATNAVFLGDSAGQSATSANGSNFLGFEAGKNASSAGSSNFLGFAAGQSATGANNSNFFGYYTGGGATGATNSNFFGRTAGNSATNASNSNFFGNSAGLGATNAYNSIFIGYQAGLFDVGVVGSAYSNNSIFIGNNAGSKGGDLTLNNSAANFTSILIGDDTSTGGFSNSIAIGKGATNTATNQLMIGSTLATGSIESVRIQAATTQCIITTGTGIACSSDERLKTNIVDISNILDKVLQLRTVTYNWNDEPNTDPQIGFLAQDLEQYFPELVETNEKGFKSVYYAQMAPILVEAIRELDLKLIGIQTLSDETFLSRIRNWFADAGNGIGKLFAKEIRTEKICVAKSNGTDFCVTGDQLESLMNIGSQQVIYVSGDSNIDDSVDLEFNNEEPSEGNEPIIEQSSEQQPEEETIEEPVEEVVAEESPVIEEPQPIIEPTPVVEENPQTE